MIFLKWHLGLGDAIICNGLVRELAKKENLILPCYEKNLESVKFMFRDIPQATTFPVIDSEDIYSDLEEAFKSMGYTSIPLGYYSDQGFDDKKWDQEFYRQAGVPFECRWSSFKVDRDLPSEVQGYQGKFYFVHMDQERGFGINTEKLPREYPCIYPTRAPNIFQWTWMLENAEEVHCINSSFLCLADSLPLKAKRKVLHQYARPEGVPTTLSEGWEVLI